MGMLDAYLRDELSPGVIIALSTLGAVIVFALNIVALALLRSRRLPSLAKVLWAILIVMAPFMGSLAFLIVQPRAEEPEAAAGKTPLDQ
jgi:hypothetical protein